MTKTTHSWWRVILSRWPLLVAVPLLNLFLIVAFWQSQITHYKHSTKGVLFMWLVAGLIFILLQLSLQVNAFQAARKELTSGPKRIEVLWSLISQIILFTVISIYNLIVLAVLLRAGVLPNEPLDFLILGILGTTIIIIGIRYKLNMRKPYARLLLATGMKATPQWVQAANFTFFGSLGMSIVTIMSIMGMGILRYASARHSAVNFQNIETKVARTAALRDLISLCAMFIGWLIGRS